MGMKYFAKGHNTAPRPGEDRQFGDRLYANSIWHSHEGIVGKAMFQSMNILHTSDEGIT